MPHTFDKMLKNLQDGDFVKKATESLSNTPPMTPEFEEEYRRYQESTKQRENTVTGDLTEPQTPNKETQ